MIEWVHSDASRVGIVPAVGVQLPADRPRSVCRCAVESAGVLPPRRQSSLCHDDGRNIAGSRRSFPHDPAAVSAIPRRARLPDGPVRRRAEKLQCNFWRGGQSSCDSASDGSGLSHFLRPIGAEARPSGSLLVRIPDFRGAAAQRRVVGGPRSARGRPHPAAASNIQKLTTLEYSAWAGCGRGRPPCPKYSIL